jgi:Putative peptidoglycan binding domain
MGITSLTSRLRPLGSAGANHPLRTIGALVVTTAALCTALAIGSRHATPAVAANTSSSSSATVTQGPLSSQVLLDATLGYTGSYTVTYQSPTSNSPNSSSSSSKSSSSSSESHGSNSSSSASRGEPAGPASKSSTTTTTVPSITKVPPTTTTTAPSITKVPPTTTTTVSSITKVPPTTTTTVPSTTTTVPSTTTTVPSTTTTVPTNTTTTTDPPAITTAAFISAAGSSPSGGRPSSSRGASSVFFTALPAVGQVVSEGESIYSLNGKPVVLLYGSTPTWRTLTEGLSGPDVAELNHDLISLGYTTRSELSSSDHFSSATASAVKALQRHLGVSATGTLALGQAVFLPSAARITSVTAALGAPAQSGSTVLQATSTTREITATIEATRVSEVHVGDLVSVTLPDGDTTPGTVAYIGTTATASSNNNSNNGSSGSSSPPTVNVGITPTDPAATGVVDQAPVTVIVTTATVSAALAVPVAALVTTPDGRAAVEVGGRLTHLVAVTPGLFDDANGLIQVHTSALRAGQQVRLPADASAA